MDSQVAAVLRPLLPLAPLERRDGFQKLSQAYLDDIVAKKAEKLAAYQQRVPNVVLLMVADGSLASGLVRYEDGPVAGRGFQAVYLLYRPKGEVQPLVAPAGN